jgi:hypothetical protein
VALVFSAITAVVAVAAIGGLAPFEAKASNDADHRQAKDREKAVTPARLSRAVKRGDPSGHRSRRPSQRSSAS